MMPIQLPLVKVIKSARYERLGQAENRGEVRQELPLPVNSGDELLQLDLTVSWPVML